MSQIADLYVAYRLLKKLITPFDEMDAYKYGIIDKNGKSLKKLRDLSKDEKNAYTALDRMVINIKRLMLRFGLRGKLATISAAMFLLREEHNTNYVLDENVMFADFKRYLNESHDYYANEWYNLDEISKYLIEDPKLVESTLNSLIKNGVVSTKFENNQVYYKLNIDEEMANVVAGGNIAGLGIDKAGKPGSGEPPGRIRGYLLKRKKLKDKENYA